MKAEREQYHPLVGVSFQENAWVNDVWAKWWVKNRVSQMQVPLEPSTVNPQPCT